jgi:hypothetical protein
VRIRALVHIAGPGFNLGPGDETDQFPEDQAMRLVAKNAAVAVDVKPPVERAVVEPTALETRDEAPKRGRKGKRG